MCAIYGIVPMISEFLGSSAKSVGKISERAERDERLIFDRTDC